MPIAFRQMKRKNTWKSPAAKRQRTIVSTTTVNSGRRFYRSSRRGRRGRGRRRNQMARPMLLKAPVPQRMMTKLNYVETMNESMGGTTGYWYWFWRTSIFDPNLSGAGHQPLWHDQYANLYWKYRVHGIKYRITMQNLGDMFFTGAILHVPSTGSGGLDLDTEMERRNCVRRFTLGRNDSGKSTTIVSGYMDAAKAEGISRQEYNDNPDYTGAFGANPAKCPTIQHFMRREYSGTAIVNVRTELQLLVEFIDRKMVGGS